MKRNEGTADRIIRGGLGALVTLSGAALYPVSFAVELLGVAIIVTALTGWCPIYEVLHLNTRHVRHGR